MTEKWMEIRKGADFKKIGEAFSIDPVIARIIRNRDVIGMDEIEIYYFRENKRRCVNSNYW